MFLKQIRANIQAKYELELLDIEQESESGKVVADEKRLEILVCELTKIDSEKASQTSSAFNYGN